ncbi:MAG TPA: diaminopimelate epimerase [Candidatus Angelobacter sp.]|jgi:diaminopimelate epimerase
MKVPFTKASACGNDFLIIDGLDAPADLHQFSKQICDRHNGVGADGVEWLFPADDADMHARLVNADGSEAEISGNGTRCVAAYLVSQGHAGKVAIRTGAGVKICELISRDEHRFEFEMEMGEPKVGDEFSMTVGFAPVHGTPVSMGNPHYVLFVKDFSPVWQAEGAEIGRHHDFKDGVNVEFVRLKGPNEIDVRFYERGAGETQSSGTGSCAAAVAAIAAGHVISPVKVHAPGGAQVVRWTGGKVLLRGPAQLICQGEFLG